MNGGSGNVIIGVPVSSTNTGAVVHTVNHLYGYLKKDDQNTKHYFIMQTEWDAIPPTSKAPLASSYAVQPNSSVTKIIGFASYDPNISLTPGAYRFEIGAIVDGHRQGDTRRAVIEFDINNEVLDTVKRGHLHVNVKHYK